MSSKKLTRNATVDMPHPSIQAMETRELVQLPAVPARITANTLAAREQDMVHNVLMTRLSFMEKLMDPRRDLDKECGYPESVSAQQYKGLFKRDPIARRVITLFPDACWETPPEVYEDESSEVTTPFELAVKELDAKHHFMTKLYELDVAAGIGHFGVMLIGIKDGKTLDKPARYKEPELQLVDQPTTGEDVDGEEDPKKPPVKPVPGKNPTQNAKDAPPPKDGGVPVPTEKLVEVLYLRVFDESQVQISAFEQDPRNPRFGKPTMYKISLFDPTTEGQANSSQAANQSLTDVHWTRIHHFKDGFSSSPWCGEPRCEVAVNRLMDLQKLYGGSAEMFWRGAFPGYSMEMSPDVNTLSGLDNDRIRERMDQFSNKLSRYIAVLGLNVKSLAPQVADPASHIMQQLTAIAIVMGAPVRMLMGSEEAKLASSQDSKNWNRKIRRRCTTTCNDENLRPAITHLISLGCLPVPKTLKTSWPELDAPSPQEKAEVFEKVVKALTAYMSAGLDTFIPPMAILTHPVLGLGLDQEDAEAILSEAKTRMEEDMTGESEDPLHIKKNQDIEREDAIRAEEAKQLAKAGGPPTAGGRPGKVPPKAGAMKPGKKPPVK